MYSFRPGAWYLLYTCENCKSKEILFPDLSNGTSVLVATYTVVCSKCEHQGTYDGEKIERYQHPAGTESR